MARAAAEAGERAVDSRAVGAEVPKGVDWRAVASMAVASKAVASRAVGWTAELTAVSLEAVWVGQEVDFSVESAAVEEKGA